MKWVQATICRMYSSIFVAEPVLGTHASKFECLSWEGPAVHFMLILENCINRYEAMPFNPYYLKSLER